MLEESLDDGGNGGNSNHAVVEDLINRANILIAELQQFRERLKALRQEASVELGHFRSTIQSELNMLKRLSTKPEGLTTTHVAKSSNLPFLEALWNVAKRSKDIVSLQKRIYTTPGVKQLSQGIRHVDVNRQSNGKGKSTCQSRPGHAADDDRC
jgi:hypothetical protein